MNPQEKLLYNLQEAFREKYGAAYDEMTEDEQAGLLIQVINDHVEQMRVVTDSRGNTVSATKTIKCYKYYSPYFKNFKAYRTNKDGNIDELTYLQLCAYIDGQVEYWKRFFNLLDETKKKRDKYREERAKKEESKK